MRDDLRARAISTLKAKSHFWQSLTAGALLSMMFVLIWAFSGGLSGGIEGFWPVWPIAGIALGVVFTGTKACGSGAGGPSEDQIQGEMKRLG